RHARFLALDVPEGDVDPAERDVVGRAGPPVAAGVGRLPEILDLTDVAADQARLEPLLDRRDDRAGCVVVVRAADPVEPRLVGQHLDDQPRPGHAGTDAANVGDLGHRSSETRGFVSARLCHYPGVSWPGASAGLVITRWASRERA